MKQENTTTAARGECRPNVSQSTTPSRLRTSTKTKDFPKPEAVRPKAKSVTPEVNKNAYKARKPLVLNKPKAGEDAQKGRDQLEDARIVGRSGQRPRLPTNPNCSTNEEDPSGKTKQLQQKLELSDNLVKNLQSEVMALKTHNLELHSLNNKLTLDLAAAQAKIAALVSRDQGESVSDYQSPKFKDIQELIANKLEHSKIKETINEPTAIKTPSALLTHQNPKPMDAQTNIPACPTPPPPPPPPLPQLLARATTSQKAPALVEFYHSLTKHEGKKYFSGPVNYNKLVVSSAHSSIVGEIQNRSAHLLAIKVDIETKGEFINGLIKKVLAAAYTDIEDVLKFVDMLDRELSSLSDEHAVLKHFKWPERKADAMREAAIEYRDLKLLESDISSYKDDTNIPCAAALKKIASLLDKSERRIQGLTKLRNSVMPSYKEYKIPVDWMLDSGIVSKIKKASMKLAKMYMERVMMELESVRNSERESAQEALLLKGVHFAYRAHEFAGGLDSETLCAFEEIRQRVPGHLIGSRELMAGIPSS